MGGDPTRALVLRAVAGALVFFGLWAAWAWLAGASTATTGPPALTVASASAEPAPSGIWTIEVVLENAGGPDRVVHAVSVTGGYVSLVDTDGDGVVVVDGGASTSVVLEAQPFDPTVPGGVPAEEVVTLFTERSGELVVSVPFR